MKGILTEKYKVYTFDESGFSATFTGDLNDGFACRVRLKSRLKTPIGKRCFLTGD